MTDEKLASIQSTCKAIRTVAWTTIVTGIGVKTVLTTINAIRAYNATKQAIYTAAANVGTYSGTDDDDEYVNTVNYNDM